MAEGARTVRRATTVAGAEPGGRPVVVPTLIVVNVAIFLLTAAQAGSAMSNSGAPLFQAWLLTPQVIAFEPWRIVTSGFLHFGLIHLAFNMLALWIVGRDLETVLGRGRFLALYMVSMLGGAAAVMLFSAPNVRVAGASGAVFGLFGAIVVVLRRLRRSPGPILGIIAINVAISFLPQISLQAHVGGLVVGAAVAAALVYAPPQRRNAAQLLSISGLALLLLTLITLVAVG